MKLNAAKEVVGRKGIAAFPRYRQEDNYFQAFQISFCYNLLIGL